MRAPLYHGLHPSIEPIRLARCTLELCVVPGADLRARPLEAWRNTVTRTQACDDGLRGDLTDLGDELAVDRHRDFPRLVMLD